MSIDWRERNPEKLKEQIKRALSTAPNASKVAATERVPPLREFLNRLRNPFFGHLFDSVKRARLRAELLAQLKALPPRGMVQFKLKPHDEAYAAFALVIEEIRRDHPEYGVIRWKGGNAIIRSEDEELLRIMDPTLHAVNVASGFVEKGG
jgi:hypothetical protein